MYAPRTIDIRMIEQPAFNMRMIDASKTIAIQRP